MVQKAILYSVLIVLIICSAAWILWNFSVQGISLSAIWQQTDTTRFCCSVLLISLALPCVALRWEALLPPRPDSNSILDTVFMTGVLCVAFVCNFVLPGPVGEGVSAWMVHKRLGISVEDSLSALGISRVIGLGSACSIAGLVYVFSPFEIAPEWKTALVVSSLLLFSIAIALSLLVFFPKIPRSVVVYMRQYSWLQQGWRVRLMDMLQQFLESVINTVGRGWFAYMQSIFWAIFGHAMVALGIYQAILSMGYRETLGTQTIEWSAVLFTYSASIAASIVMFILPGSSIGWDALFASTLSITAGIPMTVAIAVTAIVRLQQVLVSIFGLLLVLRYAKDILDGALLSQQR